MIFNVGDLVRLKSSVYEEGVILLPSDDTFKKNHYYVIFCQGTSYEAKPWLRFLRADELVLVREKIYLPTPPPKFKK